MLAAVLLVTVPNWKPPKAHPSGMDARIYSHNGIQKMEFRQQKIHSVRKSTLLLHTQPAESARYHLCVKEARHRRVFPLARHVYIKFKSRQNQSAMTGQDGSRP